jgi:hypothetical protein
MEARAMDGKKQCTSRLIAAMEEAEEEGRNPCSRRCVISKRGCLEQMQKRHEHQPLTTIPPQARTKIEGWDRATSSVVIGLCDFWDLCFDGLFKTWCACRSTRSETHVYASHTMATHVHAK